MNEQERPQYSKAMRMRLSIASESHVCMSSGGQYSLLTCGSVTVTDTACQAAPSQQEPNGMCCRETGKLIVCVQFKVWAIRVGPGGDAFILLQTGDWATGVVYLANLAPESQFCVHVSAPHAP
jgi:hypothetical protein